MSHATARRIRRKDVNRAVFGSAGPQKKRKRALLRPAGYADEVAQKRRWDRLAKLAMRRQRRGMKIDGASHSFQRWLRKQESAR